MDLKPLTRIATRRGWLSETYPPHLASTEGFNNIYVYRAMRRSASVAKIDSQIVNGKGALVCIRLVEDPL